MKTHTISSTFQGNLQVTPQGVTWRLPSVTRLTVYSVWTLPLSTTEYYWLLAFASISVVWSQIWMVILEYWKIYIQTQSSNSCPKSRDKHLLFKNAWKGIIDGICEFYKIFQETLILNLNVVIQLIKSILRNQIFQCGHILSLQSSSFAVKFVWKYDG